MTRDPPESSFFVVGIGASAGGLDAVSALLRRTTVDGAAFVVVQHLAPNQDSMLTELLGRASIFAVETVVDGVVIQKNHVYVTPPNAVLVLEGATIRLVTPSNGSRPEMPIDAFFRSLADNRGIKAMGVVLSGTGTDGTFGLAAIKAGGGITFVQEPASTKFDVQFLLTDLLQGEGYEVATATDGAEALAYLRAATTLPCLILLDLIMPNVDGWQFLEERSRDPRFSQIPIALISGQVAARGTARSLGLASYIEKPISVAPLREMLARIRVSIPTFA
jgi:chemotaxis response regulator CheB